MRNVSLCLLLILSACASPDKPSDRDTYGRKILLKPIGTPVSPEGIAVIRRLTPSGPAKKFGLLLNDKVVSLNGRQIHTAAELDSKLKSAPKLSELTIKRDSQLKTIKVELDERNPRLGASTEPQGLALVKYRSPYVAYMHTQNMTIYAQTSSNEAKSQIHLNLIVDSSILLPTAQIQFRVYEKGGTKPLYVGRENVDALGTAPFVFSKEVRLGKKIARALWITGNINQDKFAFEFQ